MILGRKRLSILCAIGLLIQLTAIASVAPKSYVKGIYSLPLSLDPIKMNDTASLVVGNLIYDGLLKFSPSLKIENALAESWSTSKDGKILTFKLKSNIYFHSGEAITAKDAEVSLRRASSKESTVRKYYDSIKKITAVDNKTLEIELNFPFPPFISVLAGATAKVLPHSKISEPKFFENPIGSGAFRFTSINKSKKEVSLAAFEQYYAGKAKISHMILKETTEDEALNLANRSEMHDLANWPLTERNSIFNIGQKVSSPVAATWIIGVNTLLPPFNDLKTRQLFKLSVPVDEFRQNFYPDSIKANGYIPNGLPGSQVKITFNINNVKPPKSKVVIAIPIELARAEEMKQMIEKDLKGKGWNIEVRLMAWSQLMNGYEKKSHQAFLVSMNMDYPDAEFLLKNFESDNPDNFSGLNNKEVDALLKKSRATQDRKLRELYYKSALELVEASAVTVNLFHPRANYWVSKCVKSFKPNILSDVYINYLQVSLAENCSPEKLVQR
jgi:ABC-type transport system substrate-binding protein